jgi:hypothetical protein
MLVWDRENKLLRGRPDLTGDVTGDLTGSVLTQ